MNRYIEDWKSEIGMTQEWSTLPCDLPQIEYKLEEIRLKHKHFQLEDVSATLVQSTHQYIQVNTIIINVPFDLLQEVIGERYWMNIQVTPMLPGTNVGYFRISGIYILLV